MSGALAVVGGLPSCTPSGPTDDVLQLQTGGIDVDDGTSRGEWWPCDARLTATGCVGEHHVNVFLSPPDIDVIEALGGNSCVVDGVAQGAFEILQNFESRRADPVIGEDLNVFILLASDVDGDGGADLEDPTETTLATRLVAGSLRIASLESFEAPLSIRIEGTADTGDDVVITFLGAMTNPTVVPTLEPPTSCVDVQG